MGKMVPDDFEGVVMAGGKFFKAGEELPDGVEIPGVETEESPWARAGADGNGTPKGNANAGSDGGETDYAKMDKKGLVAAVEARNEGREDDDKLSTSGTKAELAAALEADDAAQAGE
jgi:hypothetical protein